MPTAHTNTPLKLVSPWASNDGGDDRGASFDNELTQSEIAQQILNDKMNQLELKWAARSGKQRLSEEDCYLSPARDVVYPDQHSHARLRPGKSRSGKNKKALKYEDHTVRANKHKPKLNQKQMYEESRAVEQALCCNSGSSMFHSR